MPVRHRELLDYDLAGRDVQEGTSSEWVKDDLDEVGRFLKGHAEYDSYRGRQGEDNQKQYAFFLFFIGELFRDRDA